MKKIIFLILGSLLFEKLYTYKITKILYNKGMYYSPVIKSEIIQSNLEPKNFLKQIKAFKTKFIGYKIYHHKEKDIYLPQFEIINKIELYKPNKIIIDRKIIKKNSNDQIIIE